MTTLETETCSRCGGTGQYSYCQRYGTKCFKCAGQKVTLTKRGAAAAAWLEELRSVPAGEVKVGDLIRFEYFAGESMSYFFAAVESIEAPNYKVQNKITGEFETPAGVILLTGSRMKWGKAEKIGAHYQVTRKIRKGWTGPEKAAQFAAALAYQATLTKAGTPRKKLAKETV